MRIQYLGLLTFFRPLFSNFTLIFFFLFFSFPFLSFFLFFFLLFSRSTYPIFFTDSNIFYIYIILWYYLNFAPVDPFVLA